MLCHCYCVIVWSGYYDLSKTFKSNSIICTVSITNSVCFDWTCVCGIYILEFIVSLQHPCLKQGIPLEADLIKLMSYLMYVSDVLYVSECWCIAWPSWWPRELTALQGDETHSKKQNTTKHFANQVHLVQNNMLFNLFYIWEMGELIFLLLLLFIPGKLWWLILNCQSTEKVFCKWNGNVTTLSWTASFLEYSKTKPKTD